MLGECIVVILDVLLIVFFYQVDIVLMVVSFFLSQKFLHLLFLVCRVLIPFKHSLFLLVFLYPFNPLCIILKHIVIFSFIIELILLIFQLLQLLFLSVSVLLHILTHHSLGTFFFFKCLQLLFLLEHLYRSKY